MIVWIMIAAVVLMCFQYRQRQTVKVLSDRLSRLLMEGRYDVFLITTCSISHSQNLYFKTVKRKQIKSLMQCLEYV